MTDRELLEMAAKAAGFEYRYADALLGCEVWNSDMEQSEFWNPLDDDGGALRLASKLAFQVHIFRRAGFSTAGSVLTGRSGVMQENFSGVEGQWSDDAINAATRRAIVRAAAEVGRKMP